ncbi:MAG: hypothetical protein AAFV53_20630 [Myxococcota bacterium]
MSKTVADGLAEFSPEDNTYRLIDGFFGLIPGAQPLSPDPNLHAVAERLGASVSQTVLAQQIAMTEPALQDILWMSRIVDTGDKGYAIFTGVSSAVKMFWGSEDEDDEPPSAQSPKAQGKAAGRAKGQGKRHQRRRAKGYYKGQWRHQIRRYRQLLRAHQQGGLDPQERQELRFLQKAIRQEVERRQASGLPTPTRRPIQQGRGGPPRFPGGPGRRGRRRRPRARGQGPAWASMPEDDFGDDFASTFEDYETDAIPPETEGSSAWEAGLAALETDTQQRNDAILKALAIAYMAHRAFPGSVAERAQRFAASPAGQGLLVYFAAIEVGLPFADNALLAGGKMMDGLLGDQVETQLARLSQLAAGRSLGDTAGMLQHLTGWMQTAVDAIAPYVDTIAQSAKDYLPISADVTDKVAGLAANAADVMPCYRLLGARLAAEAAVLRAMDQQST